MGERSGFYRKPLPSSITFKTHATPSVVLDLVLTVDVNWTRLTSQPDSENEIARSGRAATLAVLEHGTSGMHSMARTNCRNQAQPLSMIVMTLVTTSPTYFNSVMNV